MVEKLKPRPTEEEPNRLASVTADLKMNFARVRPGLPQLPLSFTMPDGDRCCDSSEPPCQGSPPAHTKTTPPTPAKHRERNRSEVQPPHVPFRYGDYVVSRLRGALHRHKEVAYSPVDPVGNHHLDIARRLTVHRFHDPPMGYIPFIGDERLEARGETQTKLRCLGHARPSGRCGS